jgi:rhodanese-related sulfurtransferase
MGLISSLFGNQVSTISVQEVNEKLMEEKRPFLLDVRQPEEFRLGHIAGAKLIPLGDLDRRLSEVPRDHEVICICASGHRSVPAVSMLVAAGYTASSMKNGMIAWQMARLPIIKGM